MLAVRRLALGLLGLAIFACIGLAAALTRPTATAEYAIPTLVGAAAGAFALTRLVRSARGLTVRPGSAGPGSAARPGSPGLRAQRATGKPGPRARRPGPGSGRPTCLLPGTAWRGIVLHLPAQPG